MPDAKLAITSHCLDAHCYSWTEARTAGNGNNPVLGISLLPSTSHCPHQDSSLRFSCLGFNTQTCISNQHLKGSTQMILKSIIMLLSAFPLEIPLYCSCWYHPGTSGHKRLDGWRHCAHSTPLKFHRWADTALGNMTQWSAELNSQSTRITYPWHFQPKTGGETWIGNRFSLKSCCKIPSHCKT